MWTVLVAQSCLTLCDPTDSTRLLCSWNSLGKNTGVVCHPSSRGTSQPRVEPWSPASQADSLLFELQGSLDSVRTELNSQAHWWCRNPSWHYCPHTLEVGLGTQKSIPAAEISTHRKDVTVSVMFGKYMFSQTYTGEGSPTPLQYSCLENPMDGGVGGLQSMGSWRVRHDWATSLSLFTFTHWRRKWQPTPVFLPGESQGQGSLVGCCLWGRTESDTVEVT